MFWCYRWDAGPGEGQEGVGEEHGSTGFIVHYSLGTWAYIKDTQSALCLLSSAHRLQALNKASLPGNVKDRSLGNWGCIGHTDTNGLHKSVLCFLLTTSHYILKLQRKKPVHDASAAPAKGQPWGSPRGAP